MILFAHLIYLIEAYEIVLSTDQKTLKLKGLNETLTQVDFRKHGKYDNLEEVTFEGFHTLGQGIMDGCMRVRNINFVGNSLKIIEPQSFRDCQELIDLHIPEGVISIGDHSLYQCIKLKSISIPSTLQSFGDKNYVFSRTHNLQNFVVSPENPIFSNSYVTKQLVTMGVEAQ